MATLTLRGIRKTFAGLEAIRGIDLDVEDREFVVFVGPSGCGKSTLLRMIAGLEEISSGDLLIDDARVNDLGQAERDRKVNDAAKVLQLGDYLDRKPGQLSGGQRQRVAIGRAIVRNPKVFLFDEPLSNLDAALRGQMRIELARLHEELQATMIYVTHDQVEAMTMADKIVVLQKGEVEQVGSPLELYHHPRNLFVAGFIGSPRMNMLPGRIVDAGPAGVRVALEAGLGAEVLVPVEATAGLRGQSVTFGVRPEGLSVASDGDIAGEAMVIERLGGLTLLHVKTASAEPLVVQTDGENATRLHAPIRLVINPATCHVFGADGLALPRLAPHHLTDAA